MIETPIIRSQEKLVEGLSVSESAAALSCISARTEGLLRQMFVDPRLLEKPERSELVAQLREHVAQYPKVSELRVLFGMALCVDLDAQTAMEELAEAVTLAPDSFIAHLKMGELWMRLRVCQKAADHTRQASFLAQNLAQSELARRQAATIRTMLREGIERDGYATKSWFSFSRLRRLWTRGRNEELATAEAR